MSMDERTLRVSMGVALTHEQECVLCMHGTVRVLCNRSCYINITMVRNGTYMVTA